MTVLDVHDSEVAVAELDGVSVGVSGGVSGGFGEDLYEGTWSGPIVILGKAENPGGGGPGSGGRIPGCIIPFSLIPLDPGGQNQQRGHGARTG